MLNSHRFFASYAHLITRHPAFVFCAFLALFGGGLWSVFQLKINSNQLDLISQDLREVKDVKRIIDMIGGSGQLMLALRSSQEHLMKQVADDIAGMLQQDKAHVRHVTYRVPVDYMQERVPLFMATEDLLIAKQRINTYLREQIRRQNPFFVTLVDKAPPVLEWQDLKDKYSHVGKKTILDDYYISSDRYMLMLLIKPMWDTNELGKTKAYIEKLNQDFITYNENNRHQVRLVEDYSQVGRDNTIYYGYTGSYKTAVDDSYAISQSLEPVSLWAFMGIAVITILFFRRLVPTVIVLVGVVIGTILSLGFAYWSVGSLNMITSILGGIIMGFGVDYGIHFMFRTRIELGLAKPYKQAIFDALVNAGRPALVSAIVTGGSFFVLLISGFAGFSQFGLLAGFGTLIIGLTMFSFCASVLLLLGHIWPDRIADWIGVLHLQNKQQHSYNDVHIPHPGRILVICLIVVGLICGFAIPWQTEESVVHEGSTTLWQRFVQGVRFNYNTRALMAEEQTSIVLQDEINRRFDISSDPIAVFTKTLDEAKLLYDYLQEHREQFTTVDQVVSLYSFLPQPEVAEKNAQILAVWREELDTMGFSKELLPADYQDKWPLLQKMLHAKPYHVEDIPEIYKAQFHSLPSAAPENQGYLTYIYPKVNLFDGKQLLMFADQTSNIELGNGQVVHGSGLAILYAKLARIVLWDGKVTVLLTTLWILLMHYLDFRSVALALASVLPLGLGLVMMLGIMCIIDHPLNFMNIITLPILLGFGVSHGLYLLHRFLEGTSPIMALRSVGSAVASSTLTTIAGFAALLAASHNGLQSMGTVACIGLSTTLLVSFTVLAAVLQMMYDRKNGRSKVEGSSPLH